MSTITHVAGEAGKWALALVLLLAVVAVAAVVVLFVGALVWALPGALWGERLWFAAAAALVPVALAWAWIKNKRA